MGDRRAGCARRTLFRGLAASAAGTAAACGFGSSGGVPSGSFEDDFTTGPNGPLEGRVSATGHQWVSCATTSPEDEFYVDRGTAGLISGRVPRTRPGQTAAASYASVALEGIVGRVGAEFSWERHVRPTTTFGIGAFTFPTQDGVIGDGTKPTEASAPGPFNGGANLHLALLTGGYAFAVFGRGAGPGGDFTVLTPEGAKSSLVVFPASMADNGWSVYRVEMTISGDAAEVRVNDEPPQVFRDPRIASVPAMHPFFESFTPPGDPSLIRLRRVWAETAADVADAS